jgi:hypothetical protein
MIINVLIKAITTIHTNAGSRLDQPMVEVTLECNKAGDTDKYEIKFTEMCSNLVGMSDADLLANITALVGSYIKTAYAGQQILDGTTHDWVKQTQYIGKTLSITI